MKPGIPILSTKKLKLSVLKKALDYGFDLAQYDFIKTVPLKDAQTRAKLLSAGEWLVFTSRQSAKIFAHFLKANGLPPGRPKIYCLEGETAKAVKKIPNAEICGLARDAASLADLIVKDAKTEGVSFICGTMRRDELVNILRSASINVNEIKVYDTVYNGRKMEKNFDALLFFSPSAVESYFQTNIIPGAVPAFCIGNTTATAFRGHSHNPVVIANEPSQERVLEAVKNFFSATPKN